ncbi:Fusaric acid resistance protein-like [Roseomonas rosea]|uniref:Fusaric acid resistance protein-like n=1 Tax=Muricoccus roseus TaxID=198092 RepID=A0A1M6RCR2_9PROT|nr:Fusaric acid resistance protein-like [Roseomonas rosea]
MTDPDHRTRHPTTLPGRIERMRDRLADLSKGLSLGQRLQGGLSQALLSAGAAVLAYLPTQALGLKEGFWAAITAMAVVQTELVATRNSGRDQLAGAAIGGVVGVAVTLAGGQHLLGYLLAVILSVLACWLVNIASASRLAGITATIILLVPHTGTPQHMLLSRVGEVAWGALVALCLVWLRTRLGRR